jgi:UDP-glucose 4-epimerase
MNKRWSKSKVLVTGGAGFVGHHLTGRLLSLGCQVTILDDLSTGLKSNLLKGVKFIKGDIRSAKDADQAMAGCDTVFHLAARVELQKSFVDPADCFSVNIEGTANLVKAALRNKVRRMVFASSCAVYPLNPTKALSENMSTPGATPYALSKLAGEQTLNIFSELEGLSACSLRCFNIYGEGQRADSPYSAVIPKFIAQALRGEPITIFGDGAQTRDFIHVDDIVDAYLLAAERDARGVFNVGTGKSTSVKQLATVIRSIDNKSVLVYKPAKSGDAAASRADIRRAQKLLHFQPRRSLKTALASLYLSTKKGLKK